MPSPTREPHLVLLQAVSLAQKASHISVQAFCFFSVLTFFSSVELLLHLAWVALSLTLLCFWGQALRRGDSQRHWHVYIALALLILLLFPVISMTDDLAAFNNPAETEHLFRHSDATPLNSSSVSLHGLVFALLLLCFSGFAGLLASSFRLAETPLARLLKGLLRAHAVRPPPAFSLA